MISVISKAIVDSLVGCVILERESYNNYEPRRGFLLTTTGWSSPIFGSVELIDVLILSSMSFGKYSLPRRVSILFAFSFSIIFFQIWKLVDFRDLRLYK